MIMRSTFDCLSNAQEQKRSGGSGRLLSYFLLGKPHDYLWLDTTNPYLLQEEMMKAYNLNNKNIWILNVGDIKPRNTTRNCFWDMAYDAAQFQQSESITAHQKQFLRRNFGNNCRKHREYSGRLFPIGI